MSSFGCASQYESAYSAKRLGVWETADASKVKKPSTSGKSSDGRTQPIVDERGHIVKGGKKLTSFTPQLAAWQLCPTRWPAPNPAIKGTSAATMGYKGIPSDYLPSSTVQIKTRAIPGEKDGVHFE